VNRSPQSAFAFTKQRGLVDLDEVLHNALASACLGKADSRTDVHGRLRRRPLQRTAHRTVGRLLLRRARVVALRSSSLLDRERPDSVDVGLVLGGQRREVAALLELAATENHLEAEVPLAELE
jgi:hypothetical protein